jgi:hypothetical protein
MGYKETTGLEMIFQWAGIILSKKVKLTDHDG